jgi:signal transduction histidine kinase
VAQEALNNTLRHARANEVRVVLERAGAAVRLQVVDDGRGLPEGRPAAPADPAPSPAPPGEHACGGAAPPVSGFGLLRMRERLNPWGGTVHMESRPEGGVRVLAEVSNPR